MSSSSLPELVYFDSSILVGALISGSNHSNATSAFCRDLALAGSTIAFSEIARIEFLNITRNLAAGPRRAHIPAEIRSAYALDEWTTNADVRAQWIRTLYQDLDALLNQFRAVREYAVTSSILHASVPLIARYDIGAYDAVHVATAELAGLEELATCDRHFASLADRFRVHLIRDS